MQEKELENQLSRCNTVKEMLEVMTENYHCDFQLSIFMKPLIIPILIKAVSLLGLKPKNIIDI